MTYPGNLASDVVLRDGSTVTLRPLRPEDEGALLAFFESLDERSLAFRFFTGAPNLRGAAEVLSDVDQERRFGLLALRGPEERVVGHGFFAAIDAERAEVAFAVAAELQGHGLGSILLAQLAERAAEEGLTTFVADVLPQNHAMLAMFRDGGFPVVVRSEPEAIVVEMPISTAPQAIERFQERDASAARAAVAALFDPATVAVLEAGPAEAPGRVRGAAADGARALVVGGDPGEWGEAGGVAGRELLAACRAAGARLLGPASIGLLDNRAKPPLALLTGMARRAGDGRRRLPRRGRVGICAQGAVVSEELLAAAARHRVGVSELVSLGARADLTANDLLEYWEEDQATAVALLQVESFSDPRRFGRVARRVGARMPIVVLAARAAAEPPGRGLFDQVGAVRADGVEEALRLAADLARNHRHRKEPRPIPAPALVPGARPDEAAAILASALGEGSPGLDPDAVRRLLDCYGIALDPPASAEPSTIAESSTPGKAAPPSFAVSVEADPLFGPVLRCGPSGGPRDERPARLCPLDEGGAAELLPADELDQGARRSLERALEAVAALAAEHAEVAAIELDPLLAPAAGAVAASARVWVRRPPERRPWPRTWE